MRLRMHTPSVKSYTPASLLYVATSDGHRIYGSVNIYPVHRTDTHPVSHFFLQFPYPQLERKRAVRPAGYMSA